MPTTDRQFESPSDIHMKQKILILPIQISSKNAGSNPTQVYWIKNEKNYYAIIISNIFSPLPFHVALPLYVKKFYLLCTHVYGTLWQIIIGLLWRITLRHRTPNHLSDSFCPSSGIWISSPPPWSPGPCVLNNKLYAWFLSGTPRVMGCVGLL